MRFLTNIVLNSNLSLSLIDSSTCFRWFLDWRGWRAGGTKEEVNALKAPPPPPQLIKCNFLNFENLKVSFKWNLSEFLLIWRNYIENQECENSHFRFFSLTTNLSIRKKCWKLFHILLTLLKFIEIPRNSWIPSNSFKVIGIRSNS